MKVSIITVSHNSKNFIENCIASIIKQNYKNIEHIVIDNLSTDGTKKILEKYSKNISIIISEYDNGVYDAMNKGIKYASGDIIGFLNTDDFYEDNNVISRVVQKFKENPLLDACYSDLVYRDKIRISRIVRYWKSNQFISGSFSKGWCPPHPTFFARSSAYKNFGGFDIKYGIASDVELMMRFLEVKKICTLYIPEVWINMRTGGLSNRSFKGILYQNLAILEALKNHGLKKNFIVFFLFKFFLRIKQLFQR